MKPNLTQLQQVKSHLLANKEVTSWEMITLKHITRLSEYIRILRVEGMDITSTRSFPKNSNWFTKYTLDD